MKAILHEIPTQVSTSNVSQLSPRIRTTLSVFNCHGTVPLPVMNLLHHTAHEVHMSGLLDIRDILLDGALQGVEKSCEADVLGEMATGLIGKDEKMVDRQGCWKMQKCLLDGDV